MSIDRTLLTALAAAALVFIAGLWVLLGLFFVDYRLFGLPLTRAFSIVALPLLAWGSWRFYGVVRDTERRLLIDPGAV